jgi:hypothetical protein
MGFNTSSTPPDFHTGSLNPGTGGVRDTYDSGLHGTALQAEYTAELQKEATARKGILARIGRLLGAVRRFIW